MLNFLDLTRSRLRKKLLSYFFTNQGASLYLREIASILKEDAGNLFKELKKLEKEGIFISNLRGNQRYFSINRKYPLYKELSSLIFKTIGVEGELRKIINKTDGIQSAFIYGSFVRNRENGSSDIDLLVIGGPNRDSLMDKVDDLERRLQREINYNIYSEKEYRDKIKMRDSFISNIHKRPKIILKGNPDAI